jgi:putative membrane protein
MWTLFLQIIAGILGIFLAERFVPGVAFTGDWKMLIIAGGILGLLNLFIKPILKIITIPLRILTFGLFGLVINMLIVWVTDIIFPELIIQGIVPLFLTSVIVWGISLILTKWLGDGIIKKGKT